MQTGQREGSTFDSCTLGQSDPQEEVTRGNEKAKGGKVCFKDRKENNCGRWDEVGRGYKGPGVSRASGMSGPHNVEVDGKF